MKKLFSILLVAIMVLGSFSAVFAGSITMTPAEGDTGAHTYTAYQIITGTITEENGVYTYADPVWGNGVTKDADNKVEIGGKKYTAQEFLNAFKEGELSAADAAKIEAVVTGGTASENNVISGLADGYYLVKDTGTISGNMAATKYILINVKGDRTQTSKSSVPKVEKKVKDINESTETAFGALQDSADHKIGQKFPYQITATLGDGVENYKEYFMAFVDNMSEGLDLDVESISIMYNGTTDVTDAFTRTSKTSTIIAKDGTELPSTEYTWECDDLVEAAGVTALAKGDTIVLTYEATLNNKAVVGKPGNPNDVKLLFDNNPNESGKGTPGETPKDRNVVFTYNVDFNKVDQDGKSLAGAKFKLEKKIKTAEGEDWVLVKEYTLGTETTFSFEGLDDGTYRLTETEAPKNYNKIADPIEFTINATHDETSAEPDLLSLTWTLDNDDHKNTVKVTDEETGEEKTTMVTGCFEDDIMNQQGAVLPETGGMGTTVLYTLGGLLVVGAGVLLVARRKMNDR